MSAPVRLQLSRRKGFNLQAHSLAVNGLPAVRVDRSTNFGNPYKDAPAEILVGLFRDHMRDKESGSAAWKRDQLHIRLEGKNLACWCALGSPCHADVLLELANAQICEEVAPSRLIPSEGS